MEKSHLSNDVCIKWFFPHIFLNIVCRIVFDTCSVRTCFYLNCDFQYIVIYVSLRFHSACDIYTFIYTWTDGSAIISTIRPIETICECVSSVRNGAWIASGIFIRWVRCNGWCLHSACYTFWHCWRKKVKLRYFYLDAIRVFLVQPPYFFYWNISIADDGLPSLDD